MVWVALLEPKYLLRVHIFQLCLEETDISSHPYAVIPRSNHLIVICLVNSLRLRRLLIVNR